jgi:hypothetical protein
MQKILKIDKDGNIHCMYEDSLHAIGEVKAVGRASHVEPSLDDGWDVTISDDPRNGKFIGHFIGNFPTRKEALEAEVEFINENILGDTIHARR